MRSLLFAIAALFIIGGAAAIAFPKSSIIAHQGYRYQTSRAEIVSEDQSVVYGIISLGIGGVAFFAALSWKKWRGEEQS
jgi:hypothetical protein